MKKLYIASGMIALLAAATSCDKYDIYPENFDTVFALRDAGTRNVTVYSTEEVSEVPFVVMKGGSNPSASSNATLTAMDYETFYKYREESGNALLNTPVGRECYSFSPDENEQVYSVDFNFDCPDKKYDHATLYIRPAKLKTWLETNSAAIDGYIPCVPIILTSPDTVSSYSNVVIVSLNLNIPKLSMDVNGKVHRFVIKQKMGDGIYTPDGNISIPCQNPWGFKIKLKADKQMLDKYNEENNTNFKFMPEGSYTLNPTVSLAKDKTYAPIGLRIDLNKLETNTNYAIAVKIDEEPIIWDDPDNTPGDNLGVNTDDMVVYTVYVYDRVPLYAVPLSEDNVTTHDIANGDGSLAELFDGKLDTHFHSNYQGEAERDAKFGSYLEITLPQEMSIFRFDMTNRKTDATNGYVKTVHLYGTNDLNKWPDKPFAIIKDMNAAGKLDGNNKSASFGTDDEPYILDEAVKYLRFCVMESGGGTLTESSTRFWHAAELTIYGNWTPPTEN